MNRYQQQIQLEEIGIKGQIKIDSSSVLVVGAGGLGTVVATYLAAIGIGKLRIVDFDGIDETNLHRQFLYTLADVGQSKAKLLASKLNLQNELIEVDFKDEKITNDNFEKIVSGFSIVCDCTDNLSSRLILDKKCLSNKIPLLHGAVSGWEGYITIFHHNNHFQYNDLFDIKTLLQANSCNIDGISSPVCGVIGSTMANECLKIILEIESNLDGGLLYFNGLNNKFKVLALKKSSNHQSPKTI